MTHALVTDPAFGYRFIADEPPDKGITAGPRYLVGVLQKRGQSLKPVPPGHDDLVE